MALSNKIALEVIHQYGTEEHRGLVAQARFEPGELVWWLDSYSDEPGVVMTRAQIDATPQPQRDILIRYSYMRSDDQYETTLDPESDPSWFFNHSCDPNCGYDGDERIVALRVVEQGEELVYDYAMTETQESRHMGMVCHCGSPQCRGVLDFADWQDEQWVERYGDRVTHHIAQRIADRS